MAGPEHIEVADLLLGKARADLQAARALAPDERQADHVIGFHAQQATEKAMKAVLAVRGIEIPRTHDLAYLVTVLKDGKLDVPGEVADGEWLTPWAGAWRYDEVPSPIDRNRALAVAESSLQWAVAFIASGSEPHAG